MLICWLTCSLHLCSASLSFSLLSTAGLFSCLLESLIGIYALLVAAPGGNVKELRPQFFRAPSNSHCPGA